MRVVAGSVSPENAATALSLLPKLEKSRLNQTTSGRNWRIVLSSLLWFVKRFIFHTRSTWKSGSSGSETSSSSPSTAKLTSGSACSSFATWYPYSLRTTLLGGKPLTKQIFMGPWDLDFRD